MNLNLCVLEGDGIGPEIVKEAVRVLRAVCGARGVGLSLDYALLGGAAIDPDRRPLPTRPVEKCRAAQAVLLGAVGGPKWDSLPSGCAPKRACSASGRRSASTPTCAPPPSSRAQGRLPPQGRDRRRRGGHHGGARAHGDVYFGEHSRFERDGVLHGRDIMGYSVPEIERIARVAFGLARRRDRRVTSVDKANVLETSRVWRETVTRVAEEFPDVALTHLYVDNAAMQLVRDPAQFDVLVTGNLFGDILSDEASMISGSIGMLASASLGDGPFGLYEPDPRQRARHRGAGEGQSAGDHPLGGDDAALHLRPARTCGRGRTGGLRRAGDGAHPRHPGGRAAGVDDRTDGRLRRPEGRRTARVSGWKNLRRTA